MAKTSPSRVKQLNLNVNLHLLLMLCSSAMSSLHPQTKPFSFSANNSERKTNEKAFAMLLKQPYKPSLQLLKMSAKLSTKSMELQPPTKMKRTSIFKNIKEVLIRLENLKLERAVSKIGCAFLRSTFHMINLGLDEFMERDVFDDKFENLVRLTQAFSDVRRRKRVRERNIVVCEIDLEEFKATMWEMEDKAGEKNVRLATS
jgi:hypothetical protein